MLIAAISNQESMTTIQYITLEAPIPREDHEITWVAKEGRYAHGGIWMPCAYVRKSTRGR
jgi:hypothetical protein